MDTVSIADGIPQNPNQERFKQLVEKFKNVYNGIQPQFLCRAPGRVNLIGEHIDYCGYSVLPMAIDQDIVAVFATSDNNEVEISNTDESFQAGSFTIGKFSISYEKSDWYEYFKCGVQGIHDKFPDFNLKGMKVLIDGTIPRSAGLSSSSALVVCAALTTAIANGITIGKTDLAERCAECEKYIGTQGGGMDQAASCLARSGSAMLISFNPLKIQDVTLPVGCAFVVTHSLTELNKAASDHFNIRVSECRLATQILAHAKNLDWRSIRKPYELQIALGLTIIELEKFALDTLHKLPYTLNEIADLLSVTVDELISISLKSNVNREQKFELCNRIKHVLSEANRVLLFKQVCDSNTYDRVEKLGELMNQSHNSCAKLYECSSNELDELTDICRQSGALGSRLTGAGWGGCAVSLVREENLHTFITSVRDKFYINGKDSKRAVKADQSIFPTLPGCGIYVARL
ncbi:unnamed protein product [Rotaria magnacalcarata]|uniref:N-acetylgalactosamine kinase n=2 Tax=Rotaria magnacalcarata TaxID=392030 RepID=A0A819RI70_9BILA|nr:unnamed protein product [Rotaria magnacalcarata]CAF4048158.1 unnamed protein product [Rotaria magnacalcarata]